MDKIIAETETKHDSFDPTQPNNEEKIDQIIVTKGDCCAHKGKQNSISNANLDNLDHINFR